jgi:hypothetical protein
MNFEMFVMGIGWTYSKKPNQSLNTSYKQHTRSLTKATDFGIDFTDTSCSDQSLMMESETVSETSETNSVLIRLIPEEYLIAFSPVEF